MIQLILKHITYKYSLNKVITKSFHPTHHYIMISESVLPSKSKFLCNAQKGKVQVELTSLFDFISLWTVAKLEKSILMKNVIKSQCQSITFWTCNVEGEIVRAENSLFLRFIFRNFLYIFRLWRAEYSNRLIRAVPF